MGIVIGKCYTKHSVEPRELRARIHYLEEEIKELMAAKGKAEERAAAVESREEEWKGERKKSEEEIGELRKRLKEDEDRVKSLEAELGARRREQAKELWHWVGTEHLVEQMKEEQAKREVAVEKWKQLYLTIKTELDELIRRTRQGGNLCSWAAEEGMMEGLQRELKAKEGMVEALRSRVATMEKEGARREREIDILRQSLRILSSAKRNSVLSSAKRNSAVRKNLQRSMRL